MHLLWVCRPGGLVLVTTIFGARSTLLLSTYVPLNVHVRHGKPETVSPKASRPKQSRSWAS